MTVPARPVVAIVDYGMGNLYSVQQACRRVGIASILTASPAEVRLADGVILPGIGAMPDAVAALRSTRLDEAIHQAAADGRPVFGVCLGMQLLMTEGSEFGRHEGLNLVSGTVERFADPRDGDRALKVPSIGWNEIVPTARTHRDPWRGTPLEGTLPGTPFYFVHSYYVVPKDPADVIATTTYGNITYCSALAHENIFGCQFHPERSGEQGLSIYRRFARGLTK